MTPGVIAAHQAADRPVERRSCPVCARLIARRGNGAAVFNPHKHPTGGWCLGRTHLFEDSQDRAMMKPNP